jgi:Right handed beta helix region/Bacterial TSP3 repeat
VRPCPAVVLVLTSIAAAAALGAPGALAARDSDRDGLTDRFERKRSHTNPNRADSDRDGLTDRAEVRRFRTSPRTKDTDRDGLSDRAELFPGSTPSRGRDGLRSLTAQAGRTNPRRRDTDRDGLRDRYEVRTSLTNPRRSDTDGDGLSDGYEVRTSKTNPRVSDTDGDGLRDGFEVWTSRTSPRTSDTDGDGHGDGMEVLQGSDPLDPGSPPLPNPVPPPDMTAPDTTISAGPSGTVSSPDASISFGATEPASFECRLDDGAWRGCTSPQGYPGLADGSHRFHVRARDGAGNVDPTPATLAWTVQTVPPADTTAPQTTINSGPTGSVPVATASFTFSASEGGSAFQCRVDGGAWGGCTSPRAYAGLQDGSHTFEVRATDDAGNTDGSPATRTWTVDTVAPDTMIASAPAQTTTSSSASFSFGSADAAAFNCRLDGAAWSACTSPRAYSVLASGSHTFDVRARDAAGNVDPTPASVTWLIAPPADTTPPDTQITAGPTGTVTSASASFSFSATEAGSTFECRLNTGGWATCSSPTAYSGLADGSHTFQVRATDGAANTDPTPASRTWTIEPPQAPAPGTCSTMVDSVAAAQSAVSSAQPGGVVCLADGTYGSVSLSANKAVPGVTLRAANPGQATVGGITMSGQGLSVERLVARGDIRISARSQRMNVRHNDIDPGGGFGVFLYGDNGVISTVEIVGNRIHGTITDGIRLHNFRGVLIEGNEIRDVHEDGSHNDVLQTVHGGAGLVFRRNYVHDNRDGQGFFVKDGAVTNVTVEDNLFVRDPGGRGHPISFYDTSPNPADPFYTGYGALVRRNTVWHDNGQVMARGAGNRDVMFALNVAQRPVVCETGSTCLMNANQTGGSPVFVAPGSDDYRLAPGSAGVTWRPADQRYGP